MSGLDYAEIDTTQNRIKASWKRVERVSVVSIAATISVYTEL